jgi:hypothetical protein
MCLISQDNKQNRIGAKHTFSLEKNDKLCSITHDDPILIILAIS